MKVVERIRPGAVRSHADTVRIRTPLALRETVAAPSDPKEDEIDQLRRQLRRAVERNSSAFDQGFAAAVAMVAAGADAEQLRRASGVVACEWEDTAPTALDCFDTTEPMSVEAFE